MSTLGPTDFLSAARHAGIARIMGLGSPTPIQGMDFGAGQGQADCILERLASWRTLESRVLPAGSRYRTGSMRALPSSHASYSPVVTTTRRRGARVSKRNRSLSERPF